MFVLKIPHSVLQTLPFKRKDDDSDQTPRPTRPQTSEVNRRVFHSPQLATRHGNTLPRCLIEGRVGGVFESRC